MLQKWKRKGKRFRHVEKDGEETTELSVKIRAAKFRDLPMSLRILIVNLSLFLILCAVFFMAGAYLYAPQAAGRNYVEACLAGDWNSAYDVCQFPDSTFLSRKNYVNAMTWKAKHTGSPVWVRRRMGVGWSGSTSIRKSSPASSMAFFTGAMSRRSRYSMDWIFSFSSP